MKVEVIRPKLPLEKDDFSLSRDGRLVYMALHGKHSVLSTCQTNGGEREDLEGICNHQGCEGKFHDAIAAQPAHQKSEVERHQELAQENGWSPEKTAFMGTAANMQYAVLSCASWKDLEVNALATAGVTGNATCAGDPARYHQEKNQWVPCEQPPGTINLIVHINQTLSSAALTRAVVTLTEAKTAALMDLQIGSKSSSSLATGTGTDQFAIAAPLGGDYPLTWSGAHSKLGELIGKAVKDAVLGALVWQNGMDVTRCRNLFHLLGRFGYDEKEYERGLRSASGHERWSFYEANRDAVAHDPAVAACASSLASLLDQERKGHLPPSVIADQARHLCALMVIQIGTCPEEFSDILDQLKTEDGPLDLLTKAIALSWEKKWN